MSHIVHSRVGRFVLNLMRSIELRKGKTNLLHAFAVMVQDLPGNRMFARANGVAFNFTLSLFPGILFLFTLIPYIPIPDLDVRIMNFVETSFPPSTWEAARSTIQDIVKNQRGGLLSIGFMFSLYLATNGMRSLISAFSRSYKTGKRNFLANMGVSILLTFMLAFTLFLGVVLLIASEIFLDYVFNNTFWDISEAQYIGVVIGRFVVLFLLFLIGISCIYYYGPINKRRWSFLSFGAGFAAFLCIAASWGFTWYITNFVNYNKLYGSIGALIFVMIWLYIIALILLLGYELNASIEKAVTGEKLRRFDDLETYLRAFR